MPFLPLICRIKFKYTTRVQVIEQLSPKTRHKCNWNFHGSESMHTFILLKIQVICKMYKLWHLQIWVFWFFQHYSEKKIIYNHWYFNFLATNWFCVWKWTIFHNWLLCIAVKHFLGYCTPSQAKNVAHLCRKMQVMALFCSTSTGKLWTTVCPAENHILLSECKSAFIWAP